MTRNGASILCAAGAAVLAAECIQVSTEQRRGRLAVEAYSLGQRVHGVPVHISDASGTGNWFSSGVTLPYGDYKVRIEAPGFRTMSRDVRINQPNVIVRAGLAVSLECGPHGVAASGTIRHAPGKQLWVKAISEHGVSGGEAPVMNGTFQIDGLDPGNYFLLVLEGKKILYSSAVELYRNQPIGIDLRAR